MKAYLAQIRMNLRLTMRDRTVVVFNYLFPLIFFFVFGSFMHAERGGVALQVVNMVLCIGILGNGFFGAGMRSVADREQNILRRFKVAPITPGPILVSSLVTGLANYIPLVILVFALARVMYHMSLPPHPVSLLLFIALGVAVFRAFGGIIGAVANSMQESQIIVQLFYFPMLFLSGMTFPLTTLPKWLQTLAQFLPATYLVSGLQGLLLGRDSLFDDWQAMGALALTGAVAMFLSFKLFRWEKEEKMRPSAKLWVLAVFAPFFVIGSWQAHTQGNLAKAASVDRAMARKRNLLIHDARLFLGDGQVIERGAVLVKDGKIVEVYTGQAPEASSLQAEAIDASGKTVLPGLIDTQVHPGASGLISPNVAQDSVPRELAAYLFSGVTAVRSAGDATADALKARGMVRSGEKLGAELFVVSAKAADLKKSGVDGIHVILHGRALGLRAIVEAAHAAGLPVICQTADSKDVQAAVDAGVNSIEHGSASDLIPEALFEKMKQAGIAYDPALASVEAMSALAAGKTDLLDRSLVEQVTPRELIESTKKALASRKVEGGPTGAALKIAMQNLIAANRAGVTLIAGTGSGNPLVIHGPAVHREMQLWVQAGLPPGIALQAATYNAARALGAGNRIGLIRKGYDATLLVVDGNPLADIGATEHISMVLFKGERVNRTELFDQE